MTTSVRSRRNQPVLYDENPQSVGLWGSEYHHDTVRHDATAIVRRLPTNYVGNKKRLLWPMITFLEKEQVQFNSVFDAFCGSGVVSVFFGLMQKRVVCNDLLTSSAIQASCMLNGIASPLKKKEWEELINRQPKKKDYPKIATEYYVNRSDNLRLFLPEEADFIDRYRQNIVECIGLEKEFAPTCHAIYALYAMMKHINDTCFVGGRYYNGQTLAKVEHRINHQRNQGRLLQDTFQQTIGKLWFPPVPQPGDHYHEVNNSDILTLLQKPERPQADLLYLDPPYGGASSDYVMLYRFLEEFIHQKPYSELPYLQTSGDRFNDAKGYDQQFRELLSNCQQYPYWLVSFNATSFTSLEQIVALIKEWRQEVVVESVSFSYKYRKDRSQSTDCEYLILAK